MKLFCTLLLADTVWKPNEILKWVHIHFHCVSLVQMAKEISTALLKTAFCFYCY